MIKVEVCTGTIEGSLSAAEAGASRIELNSGLETGGLTPSPGTVSAVLEAVDIPVVVMVRPRSGGFVYSPGEKAVMVSDAEGFLSLGAAGVVFGALLTDGGIDREFVGLLRRVAGEAQLVFHRAFDLTASWKEAAAVLEDLGTDRILTSGGKPTAWQGRERIRNLVDWFGGSMEILPGAGISSRNAADLVDYTGCSWVHGSFCTGDPCHSAGILPPALPDPSPGEIKAVIRSLDRFQ